MELIINPPVHLPRSSLHDSLHTIHRYINSFEFVLLFDGSPWNLVEDIGVELIVQLLHVLATLPGDVIDLHLVPLVQRRQDVQADESFSNDKPVRLGTPTQEV